MCGPRFSWIDPSGWDDIAPRAGTRLSEGAVEAPPRRQPTSWNFFISLMSRHVRETVQCMLHGHLGQFALGALLRIRACGRIGTPSRGCSRVGTATSCLLAMRTRLVRETLAWPFKARSMDPKVRWRLPMIPCRNYMYSAEGNNRNNIITETALPAVCNNRNVSPGAWANSPRGASR